MKKLFLYITLFIITASGFNQIPQAHLQIWLISDSTETSGTSVNTWYDLSSNNYHFSQLTGENQPQLANSILDGEVVSFDGSNDFMQTAFQNIYEQPTTFFIVWNVNASSGYHVPFNGLDHPDSTHTIFWNGSNDQVSVNAGNYVSSVYPKNAPFTYILSTVQFNKSETKVYENTVLKNTVNAGTSPLNGLLLGRAAWNNSTYYNGNIAEIILYDTLLNEPEQDSIENYLINKYAPPVSLGEDISIDYGFQDTTITGAEKPWFTDYRWSRDTLADTLSTLTVNKTDTYTITATNVFGIESVDSIKVTYPGNLLFNDTTICLFDTITINTEIDENYTFNWSNGENAPYIEISNAGNYWLSVTDTAGYTYVTDTFSITIDSFPTAKFLADSNYQCAGAFIGMDTMPEQVASFLWNTGSTDSITMVDTSGAYTLRLTNERGCLAYDTTQVEIIGTVPEVNFEADTVCFGFPTQFTDLSVPVPPDTISAWHWDFGDGNTDTVQHPMHTYATVDTFNVTLTVYSGECSNTISKMVFVKPVPVANFGFRFSDSTLCREISPEFQNFSYANAGDTLSNFWNFGDGSSSTAIAPIKQYDTAGTFNISLAVTQANGCTDTARQMISVVENAPEPGMPELINPPDGAYTSNLTNSFEWTPAENTLFYKFSIADTSNSQTYYNHTIDTVQYNYTAPEAGNYLWQISAFNICHDSVVSGTNRINIGMPLQNRTLAWYASDSVSTNALVIDTLYDISGNHYHASQPMETYRPSLDTSNLLNGHPYIDFYQDNLIIDSLDLSGDSAVSIITVVQKTGTNSGMRYYEHSSEGAFGDYFTGISALHYNDKFNVVHTDQPDRSQALIDYPAQDTFMIVSAIHDRTKTTEEASLFINGIDEESEQSHNDDMTGTFSTENFYIGGEYRQRTSDMLQGRLLELIIISGALDSAARDSIELYLRHKYAPPVNLMYDIYVPYGFADTTITTANKAWFTDYQWSTGADDTLSTVTVSEEGTYGVTVTDIFGFESSDSLRVFYPEFNVWSNRSICLGDTLIWDLEPKGPYEYVWSTGSSDSAIAISEAGTYSVTITDTLGNSWSPESVTVSIDSFPATATLGPDTTLCNGNRLELAHGQDVAESFLWHDGSVQPYYLINGAETISVEVTNTLGCVARDTITVDVAGTAPSANYSTDRLCRDVSINFTNLSEAYNGATITGYNWNFNEIGTSNDINPDYTFTDTGEVAVTLTVETNEGCANDTTQFLDIHELPQPAFNPLQVCENASLQLQNQSVSVDGEIVNYNWQINGNNYNETTPTYTFNEAGSVPVQLVATTEFDCPDTLNTAITVKPAPNANFSYDTACRGRNVNFNNLTTTNLGQQYTSEWSFEENIESSAQHPTHVFNATGNYNVNLVVKQLGDGCTDTIQKQISVHALPTAIVTDQSGCEGTPHELQHASSWGEGEQPGTAIWLIADTTITGEPAFYNSSEVGTQQIKLIVQNASGCLDTANYEYTTNESPSVSFAALDDTVYVPVTIELANLSDPASWEWRLNENLFSEAYAPTLNIDTAGTYIITLTGTDDNGCFNIDRDTTEALVPFIDGTLMECRAIIDQGRLYVSVEMANTGSKNITNPELRLTLSNGQMFAETYSGTIYPGKEATYSFRTQYLLPENTTLEWIITELIYESDQAQANNSCSYIFGDMPQIFNPYPNPVDGTLHLDFTAVEQGRIKLRLYNLMGEIVMDEAIEAHKGLNRLQIPNPSPQGGVHTLEVTVNGTRKTFRIVL